MSSHSEMSQALPLASTGEPVVPIATRKFESGATRNGDDGKLDYDGFLSPLVLERYARYMHKNRHLADGSLRDSDNWKLGIPQPQYVKSLFRHFMEFWAITQKAREGDIQEAACAILFNTMGWLHEELKSQR